MWTPWRASIKSNRQGIPTLALPNSLALLMTCRQTRHEASVLSYNLITLHLPEPILGLRRSNEVDVFAPNTSRFMTSIEIGARLAAFMVRSVWRGESFIGLVPVHVVSSLAVQQKRVHVKGQLGWGVTPGLVADAVRMFFTQQDLEVTFDEQWE